MTPFSARLTFLGFFCLAGAIAANALYFQEQLDSNPRVTGSVPQSRNEQAEARPPANALDGSGQSAPKGNLRPIAGGADADSAMTRTRSAESDDGSGRGSPMLRAEVVRAIQRELAYRDYAVDRRDGQLDTSTRVAILNYQYDTGMALTGRPSESLLKQILFSSFQAAPRGGRTARLEADRALIVRVQRVLSRLGFGNLKETGQVDRSTRRGLREFAAFRDLPRDGRVSSRLLLELADVTAQPLAGGRIEVSGEVD